MVRLNLRMFLVPLLGLCLGLNALYLWLAYNKHQAKHQKLSKKVPELSWQSKYSRSKSSTRFFVLHSDSDSGRYHQFIHTWRAACPAVEFTRCAESSDVKKAGVTTGIMPFLRCMEMAKKTDAEQFVFVFDDAVPLVGQGKLCTFEKTIASIPDNALFVALGAQTMRLHKSMRLTPLAEYKTVKQWDGLLGFGVKRINLQMVHSYFNFHLQKLVHSNWDDLSQFEDSDWILAYKMATLTDRRIVTSHPPLLVGQGGQASNISTDSV